MFASRAAKAGILYCTVVFSAGFVLSVIRMTWVAPLSGEFVGVLLGLLAQLAFAVFPLLQRRDHHELGEAAEPPL